MAPIMRRFSGGAPASVGRCFPYPAFRSDQSAGGVLACDPSGGGRDGVGAGLAAFLDKALPGGWNRSSFSENQIRTGVGVPGDHRFRPVPDYAVPENDNGEQARLWAKFYQEAEFCQYGVLPGPAKTLRWGVPDGTRDPASV